MTSNNDFNLSVNEKLKLFSKKIYGAILQQNNKGRRQRKTKKLAIRKKYIFPSVHIISYKLFTTKVDNLR